MSDDNKSNTEVEEVETSEWLYSLDYVLEQSGPERVVELLQQLQIRAHKAGVQIPFTANTPYINTIPREKQPSFPGNREIERRIKSIIRWNAMAMVVKANKVESGIGGHISTYASAATLYEVGFNHFFKGKRDGYDGDQIYFQGHASPIFKVMLHLEFMQGHILREELQKSSLKISAENCSQPAGFLLIRIHGLCLISGNSQLYRWDSDRLWQSTRQDLTNIWKIED